MGTITIDLESLGITLTKGVTYTLELDEGFVVADNSGIANFENDIITFTAEGPDPVSTSWSLDDYHITTTWNVKLSALLAGPSTELYLDSGYIADNYFGDYPVATVYREDSSVVGTYNIDTFTAPNQISFEVPSIDLRADSNYYVYFEADTVKDTVNITNDATTEDTGTVFSTPTEADGFPGFSSSITTTVNTSATATKIVQGSATLDSNANIVADSTGLILYDATLNTTSTITCEATRILGVIELELLSSTATLDVSKVRLRNGDSILQTETSLTCDAWWIPKDTHVFLEIDTFQSGEIYREITIGFNNYGPNTSSIDWGDGTVEYITSNGMFHRYYSTGVKHVKISGTVQEIFLERQRGNSYQYMREVYPGQNPQGIRAGPSGITRAGDVVGANMNTFYKMFEGCSNFNQDMSGWDTSNITDMSYCFYDCQNLSYGNLNNWDTSNVTNMDYMFYRTGVNQLEINNWDVSNVTRMVGMFSNFGQRSTGFNLNNWDTSNVQYMTEMFKNFVVGTLADDGYTFTVTPLYIGDWDTSSVESMTDMFKSSRCNPEIGSWNTANVVGMNGMFYLNDDFDQDLSGWCVSQFSSKPSGFDDFTSSSWTLAEKPQWGDPC